MGVNQSNLGGSGKVTPFLKYLDKRIDLLNGYGNRVLAVTRAHDLVVVFPKQFLAHVAFILIQAQAAHRGNVHRIEFDLRRNIASVLCHFVLSIEDRV